MKCNAKTRSGTPCQKQPLLGKSRCRLHGGLSPSGKDHWNYKHGFSTVSYKKKTKEINSEFRVIELIINNNQML